MALPYSVLLAVAGGSDFHRDQGFQFSQHVSLHCFFNSLYQLLKFCAFLFTHNRTDSACGQLAGISNNLTGMNYHPPS